MMRPPKWSFCALAAPVLFLPAVAVYYESPSAGGCTGCHEMNGQFEKWRESTHRTMPCGDCHGNLLTLDPQFHLTNLRHTALHLAGRVPDEIRLSRQDVARMNETCRKCHRQEFAGWQAGPHSATYKDIFLDGAHNRKRALMDDCMRCHGMHFQGGIRDLVTPANTSGPWRLKDAAMASEAVIPCIACHDMHAHGDPLAKKQAPETFRPSLALFDRRQQEYVPARLLPLPEMRQGDRLVKMSPDRRQALCYQCHAPLAGFQSGSGDDRTPAGVHEGISCLACHDKHGEKTRASCATCHPRLSNCGLDVEKMDTTFASKTSRHNVHFVACADCHTRGVPRRQRN